jgi:hypothetical protein
VTPAERDQLIAERAEAGFATPSTDLAVQRALLAILDPPPAVKGRNATVGSRGRAVEQPTAAGPRSRRHLGSVT